MDATNLDTGNQRNFLRRKILPEWEANFPAAAPGMAASISALTSDARFLEEEADKRFALIQGLVETPVDFWHSQPDAMLYRLLQRYFGVTAFTASGLARIKNFIKGSAGTACPIAGESWIVEGENLVCLGAPAIPEAVDWAWRGKARLEWPGGIITAELCDALPERLPSDPCFAWFAAGDLPDTFEVSTRNAGDTMRNFSGHLKTLKELFIDAGVPRRLRGAHPVVRCKGEVIWVPGVANSGFARVERQTPQTVLKLQWLQDEEFPGTAK